MRLKSARKLNVKYYKITKGRPHSLSKLRHRIRLSMHVFLHISEVSAVMVGICQAGVGLVHLTNAIRKVDNYIDNILAINSLIFTISCVTAFLAFRSPNTRKSMRIGSVAEIFFVLGLCVMVIVSLLTTYSLL